MRCPHNAGRTARILAIAAPLAWLAPVMGSGGAPKVLLSDGNTIKRMSTDASELETIVEGGFDVWQSLVVEPALGRMFWGDDDSGQILQSNLDGSDVQSLVCGLTTPTEVAVDTAGGAIYWTDEDLGTIGRADLDGTNVAHVVDGGLLEPHGVAVDSGAGKLYWTENAGQSIRRANLDGSDVEDLIVDGLDAPSNLAIDPVGGRMYWIDRDCIKRASLDGSAVEVIIAEGVGGRWSGLALDAVAERIFWPDGTEIRSANLDGSDEQLVVRGPEAVTGVGVDETTGHVFFVDLDFGILLYPGMGEPTTLVVPEPLRPNGLFVDHGHHKVYWTTDTRIFRCNENGSGVELVLDQGRNTRAVAIDDANERMYWIVGFSEIWTADLDGADAAPLAINGLHQPRDIAIDPDGGKLYWTEVGPSLLRRANLDGGSEETIVTEPERPFFIDLDLTTSKIYWTESFEDHIRRANLDGSGIESIYTNVDSISTFALDTTARRIYWTQGFPVFSSGYGPINGGVTVDLGVRGGSIEISSPIDTRAGDVDGNGTTDRADIDLLLETWGACPCQGPCHGDLDGDGLRGMSDLLIVLVNWS